MSIWDKVRDFFRSLSGAPPRLHITDWSQPAAAAPTVADRSAPAAPVDSDGQPAPSFAPGAQRTAGPDANRATRARIHRAFNAAVPVDNRYGLSGRKKEIDRLAEAMLDQRKHGIIFGARGSGKTSLARVFGDFADEAGYVVIYNSASGDIDFAEIFRPFLTYLNGVDRPGRLQTMVQQIQDKAFSVRDLTSILLEVPNDTVLVLDEFDRITRQDVKEDVASLLKQLSDMHSHVQLLIAGIAGDVDDLLGGHPSLRRHMVAIPIGPIAAEDLVTLIEGCANPAQVQITPQANAMLTAAALGSPYHARLFGLNAALAANDRGSPIMNEDDVTRGITAALSEWASISDDAYRVGVAIQRASFDRQNVAVVISVLACFSPVFSAAMITQAIDNLNDAPDAKIALQRALPETLDALSPVLKPTSHEGHCAFQDTLAPQFLNFMLTTGVSIEQAGSSSWPLSSLPISLKGDPS